MASMNWWQRQRRAEVTATGVIACVWDLRVICFERGAWVEQVLANPTGPDVERYLACRLSEDA